MGVNFYRQIVFYKGYFEEFYNQQPPKVQRKINEVLYLVANFKIIPSKFLGFMVGTEGVYEIRIEYGGNIFRIFCFFVSGNKIVLVNGFQKKLTERQLMY